MWAASAGFVAYSLRRLQRPADDRLVPLMGVTGAFVFAAQMVNFGIPGTGSSGHLGGGLLLAAILGPHAALLVMTSVLVIQALFFADGGLLALGCNIFNLGVVPCFIAYPLLFRPLVASDRSWGRLLLAAILAAVLGLELGALSVVLQTTLSGRTELPFVPFLSVMLPIHLAIGVVEGLATAFVLAFVWNARPELHGIAAAAADTQTGNRRLVTGSLVVTLLLGAGVSWFASERPDGLEWSIERTAGAAEIARPGAVQDRLTELQMRLAPLPDYGFKAEGEPTVESADAWPHVDPGVSVSGILGSVLVMVGAIGLGYLSRCGKRSPSTP